MGPCAGDDTHILWRIWSRYFYTLIIVIFNTSTHDGVRYVGVAVEDLGGDRTWQWMGGEMERLDVYLRFKSIK